MPHSAPSATSARPRVPPAVPQLRLVATSPQRDLRAPLRVRSATSAPCLGIDQLHRRPGWQLRRRGRSRFGNELCHWHLPTQLGPVRLPRCRPWQLRGHHRSHLRDFLCARHLPTQLGPVRLPRCRPWQLRGHHRSYSETSCALGTYQPNSGQSSCLLADPGNAVASTGATAESLCAAGTYQPDSGQSSCTAAPAGTYVDTTGASAPVDCALGTFNPTTGQTSCMDAPAGSYVDSTGAISATLSQPERTASPQERQLHPRPARHLRRYHGSDCSYRLCPCTYQPDAGQTSCISAPPNTYVDATGATTPRRVRQAPTIRTRVRPARTPVFPCRSVSPPPRCPTPRRAPSTSPR